MMRRHYPITVKIWDGGGGHVTIYVDPTKELNVSGRDTFPLHDYPMQFVIDILVEVIQLAYGKDEYTNT